VCYSILVNQDLKVLEREFGALPVRTQFEHYERMSALNPKSYKPMSAHPRIYPNYFAPVVAARHGQSWVVPMRYRLRPSGSTEEIPTKYNVFNARLDSLQSRSTWSKLIGRHHGMLVINEFYEWVVDERTRKKKVVGFRPEKFEYMLTPVLWDWWESERKDVSFFSFAVITGDPPADVLAAGHDRCPIFLSRDQARDWLNPGENRVESLVSLLKNTVASNYIVRSVEP
jgi:putative SOS response-associated peptidase YedK